MLAKFATEKLPGRDDRFYLYNRLRLIGPPVNWISRLIEQNCENEIQSKKMHEVTFS